MDNKEQSNFPVSSKTFFQEIHSVENSLGENIESCINILEQCSNKNSDIQRQVNDFREQCLFLQKTFEDVKNQLIARTDFCNNYLLSKDYPLGVQFEREYYKNFPYQESPEHPDFRQKLEKLLDGLDDKSVETVILALQRLKIVENSTDPSLVLYISEEREYMNFLVEHFYSTIFQFADDCWFWKKYYLPVNHFEACVFIDECGFPYLEHPERIAHKDFIDGGAFIGDSALVFSKYTTGNIYAFEATSRNFENLQKTIELNNSLQIKPYHLALGDREGTTEIFYNESSSSGLKNDAMTYQESEEVQTITVDSFVKEHSSQIGLIKTDVEGAEQLLLHGAVETIKKQKPALLISIYHTASDFFDIKPWLESLNLGYRYKIRHPAIGTFLTETMLIAEVVD